MAHPLDKVMLTLAALAYRGFQDVLAGAPHEAAVRHALLEGLEAFPLVRGNWDLVWGPVTTRRMPLGVFDALGVFDWNGMYAVRNRHARREYVVAVRGTNPVSGPDWLFGDLWVGTTVPWPYAAAGERISTSTALGLAALQRMRSRPPSEVAGLTREVVDDVRGRLGQLLRAGSAAVGLAAEQIAPSSAIGARMDRILDYWTHGRAGHDDLRATLEQAEPALRVEPQDLRRTWLPESQRGDGLDLLTFLKTEADASRVPLQVTVTGHSKGGALAPTVALWLRDALDSTDAGECWDTSRQAQVLCHAFAAPTPGNAEFANRIDAVLGAGHHHLRNTNDIVTHAFQIDELTQIPELYGARTVAFSGLVAGIVARVRASSYRQATSGVTRSPAALTRIGCSPPSSSTSTWMRISRSSGSSVRR
jgi:Lipase (class 3)